MTTNDWITTTATITSCRAAFLSGGNRYESLSEYIAAFQYQVNGKTYTGKFKRNSPIEAGHQFEISYNPNDPSRNTGSEVQFTVLGRFITWIVGGAIAFLLIQLSHLHGCETIRKF
jgi:Protein of unknown function (DUF3592)